MAILVTGGAGYIGSHTCVELLNKDYDVVVLDNLCNSSEESLERVKKITAKDLTFYKGDICDADIFDKIFTEQNIDCVIHFAGLKAVGESVAKPLAYYANNVGGTLNMLSAMKKYNVNKLIFSSSATVYGDPEVVPIKETAKLSVTNPYGRTKLMQEEIFRDICAADKNFRVILLRYFNPIGAHKSGLIGEDPAGIPNNLLPYVAQVAVGKLKEVNVFGGDYATADGTGVRDYIHVVDLALGHVQAIEKINEQIGDQQVAYGDGATAYNLGTGRGYSVLEIIKAFGKAVGKEIPFVIKDRRAGDIAACFADPALAKAELGFSAARSLDEMCEDTWRWQKNNPNGYRK